MGKTFFHRPTSLKKSELIAQRDLNELRQASNRWERRAIRKKIRDEMSDYVPWWGWLPILSIFSKLPMSSDPYLAIKNRGELDEWQGGVIAFRIALGTCVGLTGLFYYLFSIGWTFGWTFGIFLTLSLIGYGCQLTLNLLRLAAIRRETREELINEQLHGIKHPTRDEAIIANYVDSEINEIRESLVGAHSRLSGVKAKIETQIGTCRARLELLTKPNGQLQQEMVDLLNQTISQLESSRQEVERRIAKVQAFLDDYRSRVLGHVSNMVTLQTIRDLNESSSDLAGQVEQAFRETLRELSDRIVQLNEQVLSASHQANSRVLTLTDVGMEFEKTLSLMEAGVQEAVGLENDTSNKISVLAE